MQVVPFHKLRGRFHSSTKRTSKIYIYIYIYIFLEDFFILPVYHARPARTWGQKNLIKTKAGRRGWDRGRWKWICELMTRR